MNTQQDGSNRGQEYSSNNAGDGPTCFGVSLEDYQDEDDEPP
jgi:hypothetical protein